MGKNEELGLPFGGMKKVAFCFDVDGTLIQEPYVENRTTVDLLLSVAWQKWKNVDVIVWSGGGAEYARQQVSRLLPDEIVERIKFHSKIEHRALRQKYSALIAIDDIQDTAIGDVNLIVRNK
jgi:phosphoserine phosphatase